MNIVKTLVAVAVVALAGFSAQADVTETWQMESFRKAAVALPEAEAACTSANAEVAAVQKKITEKESALKVSTLTEEQKKVIGDDLDVLNKKIHNIFNGLLPIAKKRCKAAAKVRRNYQAAKNAVNEMFAAAIAAEQAKTAAVQFEKNGVLGVLKDINEQRLNVERENAMLKGWIDDIQTAAVSPACVAATGKPVAAIKLSNQPTD